MSRPPEKIVLVDDPYADYGGSFMQFRLTIEGQLFAESVRDAETRRSRAKHKHEIRKQLHPQLKKLWSSSASLRAPQDGGDFLVTETPAAEMAHNTDALSKRFAIGNYNFVPLATRNLHLLCDIDILLLRPDPPWSIIESSGDIDNRIKTLFDAFSTPREVSQLGGYVNPAESEKPFFTLLEDDSLITKASVETDTLFQAVSSPPNPNDVRIVVTVRLWPSHITVANFGFA